MPKNVVVATLVPSFFVVTLELETDEEELASSAIDVALSFVTCGIERPKSHNFVYPSSSISTFSGFRL